MSLQAIVVGLLTELSLVLASHCSGYWLEEGFLDWAAFLLMFLLPGMVAGICAPRGRRLGTGAVLALGLLAYYVPRSGYFVYILFPLIPALVAAGFGLGIYFSRFVDAPRFGARAAAAFALLIAGELSYALIAQDLWLVLSRSSPDEWTVDHGRPSTRFLLEPAERAKALVAIAEREGKTGRREEARRILRKALRAPDGSFLGNAEYHAERVAAAAISLGFDDEAEAIFRTRMKDAEQRHFQLAGHFLRNNKITRAKEHVQAISNPGYKITALCSVAESEARSGRFDDARKTFSEAFALAADPDLLGRGYRYARDVAMSQARAGLYEEAAASVRERCPAEDRGYAWTAIGVIAAEVGELVFARNAFAQVMAAAQAQPDGIRRSNAFYELAVKQANAKLFDEAEKTAGKIETPSTREMALRHIASRHPGKP